MIFIRIKIKIRIMIIKEQITLIMKGIDIKSKKSN